MRSIRQLFRIRRELIKKVSLTACVLITTAIKGYAQTNSPRLGTAPVFSQTLDQYLVEFKGNSLPNDLSTRISALGGNIVDTFPEIKVALVAGMSDAAAAALASQTDVADVTLDEFVTPSDKLEKYRSQMPLVPAPSSASHPEAAIAYPYQWDKRVISADRAWQAGYLGSPDVRVAIIDTGIDPTHTELAGLVDARRAIPFFS